MGQVNSPPKTNIDKSEIKITFEEFIQIVEAVLEGRYSWACVLFLRFAGFNPLHYIPYRTYNRLVKSTLVPVPTTASSVQSDQSKEKTLERASNLSLNNREVVTKIAAKLIDRNIVE